MMTTPQVKELFVTSQGESVEIYYNISNGRKEGRFGTKEGPNGRYIELRKAGVLYIVVNYCHEDLVDSMLRMLENEAINQWKR